MNYGYTDVIFQSTLMEVDSKNLNRPGKASNSFNPSTLRIWSALQNSRHIDKMYTTNYIPSSLSFGVPIKNWETLTASSFCLIIQQTHEDDVLWLCSTFLKVWIKLSCLRPLTPSSNKLWTTFVDSYGMEGFKWGP